MVINTEENLALVDELIKSLQPMEMFVLDQGLLYPLGRDRPEKAMAKRAATARVERKLREIIIPVFNFDHCAAVEGEAEPDPFASDELEETVKKGERPWIELLEDVGIDFPPESSCEYDAERKLLVFRNHPANVDLLYHLLMPALVSLSRERAVSENSSIER